MKRGGIYITEVDGKRRPVVLATRDGAIPHLTGVICAAVTTTTRPVRTQVPVGPAHGLDHDSAINCDWLVTLPKRHLEGPVGQLDPETSRRFDDALRVALDLEH